MSNFYAYDNDTNAYPNLSGDLISYPPAYPRVVHRASKPHGHSQAKMQFSKDSSQAAQSRPPNQYLSVPHLPQETSPYCAPAPLTCQAPYIGQDPAHCNSLIQDLAHYTRKRVPGYSPNIHALSPDGRVLAPYEVEQSGSLEKERVWMLAKVEKMRFEVPAIIFLAGPLAGQKRLVNEEDLRPYDDQMINTIKKMKEKVYFDPSVAFSSYGSPSPSPQRNACLSASE